MVLWRCRCRRYPVPSFPPSFYSMCFLLLYLVWQSETTGLALNGIFSIQCFVGCCWWTRPLASGNAPVQCYFNAMFSKYDLKLIQPGAKVCLVAKPLLKLPRSKLFQQWPGYRTKSRLNQTEIVAGYRSSGNSIKIIRHLCKRVTLRESLFDKLSFTSKILEKH